MAAWLQRRVRHCARFLLLAAFTALSAPGAALSQASTPEDIRDAILSAQMAGDLHGSILVADKDGVIYEGSAGYANYEWDVPNALDTRFRVGSIAKQFTALLVLREVESGTIGLSDTISDHLPYYREDTGRQVTVSQLLNHASGIPDFPPDFSERSERYAYERQEFVETFCSGDLESAPGEGYSYSNAGYYILGAILEAATGQPYAGLLRSRIFEPAGMDDTVYVDDLSIIERAASGYARNDGGPSSFTSASFIDPSIPFAMAGIHSTVRDLYKWDRALYGGLLLSEDGKETMYTPLEGGTYSNGWINYRVDMAGQEPLALTMHQGSINGFSGIIFRDLQRQNLVVILNNVGSNGSEWQIGENLMKMLASRP
jgi:CubicO group peptidase (beta-lactamase class C family)